MKNILFIIGLSVLSLNSFAQVDNQEKTTLEKTTYTPLTEERFNQIEDHANELEDLIPINIQNVPREELIKFYIQSYNDRIISTWMDFAYKKMTKLNLLTKDSTQDKTFKKLMQLEQNKANMFLFMTKMTNEQIAAVGY